MVRIIIVAVVCLLATQATSADEEERLKCKVLVSKGDVCVEWVWIDRSDDGEETVSKGPTCEWNGEVPVKRDTSIEMIFMALEEGRKKEYEEQRAERIKRERPAALKRATLTECHCNRYAYQGSDNEARYHWCKEQYPAPKRPFPRPAE